MSWFDNAMTMIDGLAKSDVVRGMILQASNDIFSHRTDREHGYTEVKFANEGDDLEILGEDLDSGCGGFRVRNHDNHDQIETVQFSDFEDGLD